MAKQAIGMIETRGLIASIEAADAMAKAASVTILGQSKTGGGLVATLVRGEVGAVKAATVTSSSPKMSTSMSIRICMRQPSKPTMPSSMTAILTR